MEKTSACSNSTLTSVCNKETVRMVRVGSATCRASPDISLATQPQISLQLNIPYFSTLFNSPWPYLGVSKAFIREHLRDNHVLLQRNNTLFCPSSQFNMQISEIPALDCLLAFIVPKVFNRSAYRLNRSSGYLINGVQWWLSRFFDFETAKLKDPHVLQAFNL
ncbi:hypothetical protein KIN20_034039 [Parelaphostrongylus tenuis]|uniref:Uncharacterized protein n=1 Tax=Parelaphostrongylus tenuis TaxID=148309 RepID=A0AAD5R988_PARTN|nr:hypothetical protein KIN20_034039 [Parelaphostrongylus tenuis]